ncbi:basic proline-rich protein-like, partial [Harpia harpyja]|uniref:basic proline-rich protein-like n=1 Tax=Harpia harpyja TaxID=202280 RepID=UPI0022B1CE16
PVGRAPAPAPAPGPRSAPAPGSRPAPRPAPRRHRDSDPHGRRDRPGTAAAPGSRQQQEPRPDPHQRRLRAGARTAAELPRRLAPRRQRHRLPRRHPTPATTTRPPADPRACGHLSAPPGRRTDPQPGRTDRRTDVPRAGLPASTARSQRRQDGPTDTPGDEFSPPRSAPGAEPRGDPTPGVGRAEPPGGPVAQSGPPGPVGTPAGMGLGRRRGGRAGAMRAAPGPRRGRPASHAPRATAGHRCAWRSRPASPEEESGLPALPPSPPAPRGHGPRAPRGRVHPGGAARRRAPYLRRLPASLRRGRRRPRGHGGRLASRAEPVRVLTSPPRALHVHPGALKCSLQTCQIPGPPPLGPASHVLPWPEPAAGAQPGPGEPPRGQPSWPAGPPGPARGGVRRCSGGRRAPGCRLPCHLPRQRSTASAQPPRAYITPRLEPGQRLDRRLRRGCTPAPGRPWALPRHPGPSPNSAWR